MKKVNSTGQLSRRRFLQTTAMAGTAAAVLGPQSLYAAEPDKPDEIIVRAWGGAWGDALKAGVADGFTAATGVKVRGDVTEDN